MKTVKLLALVGLSILITACGSVATPAGTPESASPVKAGDVIIAEGRVEPVRFTEIALNASGLVSEVLVKEGDKVAAGDVIASLKSTEVRSLEDARASALKDLTAAYEAVRDAQYDLDNFDIPSDFSGMTSTEAVSKTLEKLNTARTNFEPYKNLSDKRLEFTKGERETGIYESKLYKDTAKLYKKRLDDAWADYRKAVQWMQLESDLESANAQLLQTQKDYDSLQDPSFGEDTAGTRAALANAEVRAPFPGTVTNLDLKVGEFAASGKPVVTIADLSSWVVKTTDLTEIDVVGVKEGQPVALTLDAIPDVTLNGYVLTIGQNYSEKQGDIVYEVTILLTDHPPAMRWGMTAEVKFEK
jgi:membrane fusion protein (multidrug efflux system)